MSEFARSDLLFPDESPYLAAQDSRPVFGTEGIMSRVPNEPEQTNLRFIYGVDETLDRHALAEQIGDSEVIVYCSDWGSGQPDVPGLADATEADVRHFQDPDNSIDGLEIPEEIRPVIKTLLVELGGAGREFYCAGSFQPEEDLNKLDVTRENAYREMGMALANFNPISETIALMDEYTTRAATYNDAVEQRAYQQITDLLPDHDGKQVAIICQNSFPLLSRRFTGGEVESSLTMSRYHMPWARLISGLVEAESIGRERAQEKNEEFQENQYLYDPSSLEPAHRPLIEQIIFLKQVGSKVAPTLYYNSLYSLISNHLVAAGDMYGPDVEYRIIGRPHDAREQLEFFEGQYWAAIRGDNGESEEVQNAMLTEFMKTWLRLSI